MADQLPEADVPADESFGGAEEGHEGGQEQGYAEDSNLEWEDGQAPADSGEYSAEENSFQQSWEENASVEEGAAEQNDHPHQQTWNEDENSHQDWRENYNADEEHHIDEHHVGESWHSPQQEWAEGEAIAPEEHAEQPSWDENPSTPEHQDINEADAVSVNEADAASVNESDNVSNAVEITLDDEDRCGEEFEPHSDDVKLSEKEVNLPIHDEAAATAAGAAQLSCDDNASERADVSTVADDAEDIRPKSEDVLVDDAQNSNSSRAAAVKTVDNSAGKTVSKKSLSTVHKKMIPTSKLKQLADKTGETEIHKGSDVEEGQIDETTDAEKKSTATSSNLPSSSGQAKQQMQPAGVKKQSDASAAGRNLWVSGLLPTTRAADLKALFSKYGKVVAAKVVTTAKSPGSKCFGLVTMTTAEEAAKCIQHLHRTDLRGRMITVEKAKNTQATVQIKPPATGLLRKTGAKPTVITKNTTSGSNKEVKTEKSSPFKEKVQSITAEKGDEPDLADKGRSNSEKATSKEKSSSRDVRSRSPNRRGQSSRESRDRRETWNRDRRPGGYGGPSGRGRYGSGRGDYGRRGGRMDGGRGDRADPVAAEKIRLERERERLRRQEQMIREEERMRLMELEQQRQQQMFLLRKQHQDQVQLQRLRESLRLEKEQLERERLKTERERLQLERERQEREREKIRVERIKEETRRKPMFTPKERSRSPDANAKRGLKRPFEGRPTGTTDSREQYWTEPKRPNTGAGLRRSTSPTNGDSDMRSFGGQRRVDRYERKEAETFQRRAGSPHAAYVDRDERHLTQKTLPRGYSDVPRSSHASAGRMENVRHASPVREVRMATSAKATEWKGERVVYRDKEPAGSGQWSSSSNDRRPVQSWTGSSNSRPSAQSSSVSSVMNTFMGMTTQRNQEPRYDAYKDLASAPRRY